VETTIVTRRGKVDVWGVVLVLSWFLSMVALFGFVPRLEVSLMLVRPIVSPFLGSSVETLALVGLILFVVCFLLVRGVKSILDELN